MSIEGSADGEALLLYVERLLCPTLERGKGHGDGQSAGPQDEEGERSDRGMRLPACLPAFLIPALQPRRGSLLEGEDTT
jgi:hypothetical protein